MAGSLLEFGWLPTGNLSITGAVESIGSSGDPRVDRAERQRFDLGPLRGLFQIFGATQCRGRSLVYETLSEAVASNDGLLELLLATPKDQRRPSLLFAGVNLLVAGDSDSELGSYYPIHGGRRPVDDQLAPAFDAFCDQHRDELAHLLRERSTQTNEIRRCVALRLGLEHVQRHWPGPIAVVEVGASAGLNLLFDHYRYLLDGQEIAAVASSPVVVACEIRDGSSGASLFGAAPEITSRLGIDNHPIDLSDPDARAWLEAFIWPEQVEDLATLRGAIDLAVSVPIANVIEGEACTDTARILADLPGREPVVVFTASLLSYLGAHARTAFVTQLQEAAARRRLAWVFAEAPGLVATTGIHAAALNGPLSQRNTTYVIGASLRGEAGQDDSLLALADPYLRWIAPARNQADDFQWVDGLVGESST